MAAEHQTLKELIPGALLSDHAAKIMLDKLVEIATELGQEKFHQLILKAIDTCDRRPTIARFRQLAGLNGRLDIQQEAVAAAWSLITTVVTRHIGRDGEGRAFLQPHLWRNDQSTYSEEPVPAIPRGVAQAIASMGGWGALADSWPQWTGQRFALFKELYRPSSDEVLALTSAQTTELALKNQR